MKYTVYSHLANKRDRYMMRARFMGSDKKLFVLSHVFKKKLITYRGEYVG